MKLFSLKSETSLQSGLFNMAQLVSVTEIQTLGKPTESVCLTFTNGAHIVITKNRALEVLESAEIEIG
jgi:hypothetical protein